MDPSRLPTPPAVALQVVNAASKADCDPAEVTALINQDPALCAKLLKAVNSCLYGLSKPVASLQRAVAILGLNTVRSLALGLSLPAMRGAGAVDDALRDYWVASVGGGILARELAVRARRPNPEDDLIAGLLQDLGTILLRRTFPDEWRKFAEQGGERVVADPTEAEEEAFGIGHAEVSAELLRSWNLPEEIVEPIRYHHRPERLAGTPLADRAELLYLTGHLTHLDATVQSPAALNRVLATARDRFRLTQPQLIEFLNSVAPKVEAFAGLLNQDVGQRPDFAAVLMTGAEELVKLTVETSRDRLSGSVVAAATHRPAPAGTMYAPISPVLGGDPAGRPPGLPEFRPEFIEALPPKGCRLGEYELREQLGRGAMGVVFKAFEPSLERFVAVKMLTPALAADATARERFAREARVSAAIQHENVIAIHAVRESAGLVYLAMEYVRGRCLERRVDQDGPLPVPMLVDVCRQVASGLGAAHAKQIIHRDIKPANILLEEATGRVKITDFGLARVADNRSLSTDGMLIGTPYFMAPEVVQGLTATAHSDLFSLGGVFYALATGEPPFPGPHLAAVLRAVCDDEPLRPRELRPDLPGWFEDVVLRLLKKSPAGRFPSASAVAAVLAEYAG
jgi:HD-like signal output (HDOD) protein